MRAGITKIGATAIGAALLASALAAVPAAAVVVTQRYLVSATFIQQTAPVKSLMLGFTLTFDPLASITDTAVSGYTTSSTAAQFNNLPIVFKTQYYEGFGTYATIGGAPFGTQYLEGADDFFVEFVVDAQGTPLPLARTPNVEYSFQGFRATYNTRLVTVVLDNPVTPGPGGVPEPATWAMLLIGFGAIGSATRLRQRRAVSA